MTPPMAESDVLSAVAAAVASGRLRESSAENIRKTLAQTDDEVATRVIAELVNSKQWSELDDRFYQTLAFGTGGLRGRTIGRVITSAERGTPTELGRPEFPCVGTNAMNFANVRRATLGLTNYVRKWRAGKNLGGRAKIIIAHDSRHFSQEFTSLAAQVAAENGCDAFVFSGPRSTPELSFAVRYLNADAGVVITASHNPPHDNGYKAYFNDGAQVIEPHASGIIAEVDAVGGASAVSFLESSPRNSNATPRDEQALGVPPGEITILGDDVDRAYMDRLDTLVLDRELPVEARDLKIVYTPIHGTGGVIIKPMLTSLGLNFSVVPEQDKVDGRFPTVKSPNPENAEALKLGIELAQREKADVVVGTDPDCDRMGVAVRTRTNEMKLLTGNQIGSLLAWYRTKTLFDQGILNAENAGRAVIIKTFVTTDLQKAIAQEFGLRCVETLTGFKYIGAKLGKYENALGLGPGYRKLPESETRRLRLEKSSYFVFGGEESYGYSGADFVRDKDANAAAIMFCEVAAFAKVNGQTIDELLDSIYRELGYFEEKNGSLLFEGADGAEKIRRLLASYVEQPPAEMLDTQVVSIRDFARENIHDVEGDEIPKEKMLIFELSDKTRIAVRGSGTEPKIKYYLFARQDVAPPNPALSPRESRAQAAGVLGIRVGGRTQAAGDFGNQPSAQPPGESDVSSSLLDSVKRKVGARLSALWDWLQADAQRRL